MLDTLTRRQREIYHFLQTYQQNHIHPPTFDELCQLLKLKSKGSLHKHIQALIKAGLIHPTNKLRRGIRLKEENDTIEKEANLPMMGYIAAGQPIEAIDHQETMQVPSFLRTTEPCYILEVKGDSMIDEGIFDGDRIVIEKRDHARNGEIVVALIDHCDATLKRLEQKSRETILHPANPTMEPLIYSPDQVTIQGVLVGQMRRYH